MTTSMVDSVSATAIATTLPETRTDSKANTQQPGITLQATATV